MKVKEKFMGLGERRKEGGITSLCKTSFTAHYKQKKWQFNSKHLLSSSYTQAVETKQTRKTIQRWAIESLDPGRITFVEGEKGDPTQNHVVCIKWISKEGRETKPSSNIHQTCKYVSQEGISKSYTQKFQETPESDTFWLEWNMWTLKFSWGNFDLCLWKRIAINK